MDAAAENIDYSVYDMLWLGGDMALSTSIDEETMMHVDSVFHLGDTNTLWALGNHDYADLQRIQDYTGRPAYYAYHKNNITFLVLDTQDSLSNIIGLQRELFLHVTDTISESSHLIILHHKLIWMYGNAYLQPQIPYISNGVYGDSACFSCIHQNNFYSEIYPELLKVEEKGIEVICIAGDIGFRTNKFEYLTPEGIQYLASGIEAGKSYNQALLFHHNVNESTLSWEYVQLTELLRLRDHSPPMLHSLSISPDSIKGGDSIRITLKIEDLESGLDEISVKVVNPYGEQLHSISNHIRDWTSLEDQKYTFDMAITDSAVSGLWHLAELRVIDSAENVLVLDNKDTLLATFEVYVPTGSGEIEYPQQILFPNPSSGIFHFSGGADIVSVEVYDLNGRNKKNFSDLRSNSIDLTDEPDGMYLIRLHLSEKRILLNKVLINKEFRH